MLRRREVIGWSILALVIAWPLALWGADREISEPKAPIARLEVQPARVDWLPQVDYENLILTVAGPRDLYIQRKFSAGETPTFSSLDVQDGLLPDGTYAYELRTVPKPELLKRGGSPEEPLVQSGYLWVQGGSFVDKIPIQPVSSRPGKPEAKPPLGNVTAKTTIADDLIVQGQACVGANCVVGDADGQVLRLKEAGCSGLLQIKFDALGAFLPCERRWALQANESGSSTGDFMIRDLTANTVPFRLVGAGSGIPDNSFTLFYNGNVGLGTSTPGAKLHVYGSATADAVASAGPDPVSGPAFNFGYGGASYGRGAAFLNVRPDASATAPNPSLRFATANVERMIITNTGNVGIGTSSPGARLDVKANSSGGVGWIQNTSATGLSGLYYFNNTGLTTSFLGTDNVNSLTRFDSFNNYPIIFLTNYNERMRINPSGNVGINCWNPTSDLVVASGSGCSTPSSSMNAGDSVFTTSSSRTIKENLDPVSVPSILEKISAIDVYKYDFIGGPKDRLGLMAEDFHQVFQRGSDKLINGQEVEMALWLAVKELTAQNKALTAQNQEISKRLAELEARLTVEPGDTSK